MKFKLLLLPLLLLGAAAVLAGCEDDDPLENAGNEIENAGDNVVD